MIPVRNIYYMLSYAYESLRQKGYADLTNENFENVDDLYSAIIVICMRNQITRGVNHEYIDVSEEMAAVRGKIKLSDTLKTQALIRKKVVCEFDEFSMNTYMNQVVKCTMGVLCKSKNVKSSYKKELRRILYLFSEVDDIDIHRINWNFRYNRNNSSYRLLMGICYLVIQRRLQTEKVGKELVNFFDDQKMCDLYEHFVLNFFRYHYRELTPLPAYVEWNIDDGFNDLLPRMRTDITLTSSNKTLIIDTKYFESGILKKNTRYGDDDGDLVGKISSGNIYQIYSYVKNKDKAHSGDVLGMLLYAKTTDDPMLNNRYSIDGNVFYVRTLDLGQDFEGIAGDLHEVAELVADDGFGDNRAQ